MPSQLAENILSTDEGRVELRAEHLGPRVQIKQDDTSTRLVFLLTSTS